MAKKGTRKPTRTSRGSLTGMRSGMRRVAGTGTKKKKKKGDVTFFQVFGWVLGFALLLVVIWLFTKR